MATKGAAAKRQIQSEKKAATGGTTAAPTAEQPAAAVVAVVPDDLGSAEAGERIRKEIESEIEALLPWDSLTEKERGALCAKVEDLLGSGAGFEVEHKLRAAAFVLQHHVGPEVENLIRGRSQAYTPLEAEAREAAKWEIEEICDRLKDFLYVLLGVPTNRPIENFDRDRLWSKAQFLGRTYEEIADDEGNLDIAAEFVCDAVHRHRKRHDHLYELLGWWIRETSTKQSDANGK